MNFVKVYNKQHLDDLNLDYCWSCNLHHKLAKAQKEQLERAVVKIGNEEGAENNCTMGYKVHDKSVKVWFKEHEPQQELIARRTTDRLLNLVNEKWTDSARIIDPSKLDTCLV